MGWWKKLWNSEPHDELERVNELLTSMGKAKVKKPNFVGTPTLRREWKTSPPLTDAELTAVLRAAGSVTRDMIYRALVEQETRTAARTTDAFAEITMFGHTSVGPMPPTPTADYCTDLLNAFTAKLMMYERIRRIIRAIDKEEEERAS